MHARQGATHLRRSSAWMWYRIAAASARAAQALRRKPTWDAGSASRPPSARWILSDQPIHRFPDQIGMADVPSVFLDYVDQDTPQATWLAPDGSPGQLLQAAAGQRLRDRGPGAGHGFLPERQKLLGG